MKRMNNDMAVSPIVATLVLIVVAVIGAVAVGTIMGTFSSSVSKQANAGQAASASQTQLTVAGSTTIYPAMVNVASDYMTNNPGIKISVQQGGSGAGVSAVNAGVADIGMFSQPWDTTMQANYPNIKAFQVGVGAVVPIVDAGTAITKNISVADLANIFENGPSVAGSLTDTDLAGITQVYVRSDVSGTADSFATYIGDSNIYDTTHGQTGENGNGAMASAVSGHAHSIGFTDLDYALSNSALHVVPYVGYTGSYTQPIYTRADEQNAANGVSDAPANFPAHATRPLNLLTQGTPTSIVENFMQYAASPGEASRFTAINLTPISAISNVD